ncbi:AMP-binding protein [Pseudorhodoferax sp.]|uniref:AMP-binding protein n=1 Tax=Pseudorhodoferax sp. TaxID=1993553 RepID=UPI002DD66A84|nr:AMP-binding protein [Pseudorhodoferax sp.]
MPTYSRIEEELGAIESWTLGSVLRRRAALHGNRHFLASVADQRRFTYDGFDRCTTQLALELQTAGIGAGQHVAILAHNSVEMLATYFALGKLGAVSVPINTAAVGALLRYYIGFADCTTLVLQDAHCEVIAAIAPELPLLERVVVLGDLARARAALAGTALQVLPFPALDPGSNATMPDDVQFRDLAMLLYTSGTTGPSKAIMVTHASACHWGAHGAEFRALQEGDVDYVYLPLFHGNAMLIAVMAALMFGSSIALAEKLSVSRFWDQVRDSGATRFNMIGVVAKYLWSQPPSPRDREHKVRYCWVTPAPPFLQAFEQRFNMRALGGYGLTDYCIATSLLPRHAPDKSFTSGSIREGVQLRIVDDRDDDVEPQAVGEIVLRSDFPWGTPPGYYKMPQETLASRRNLWFHTGDLGFLDAEGFLHFVDRKKDAIRRRGENISAFEVETVLASHPDVEAAAVYGVASADTEEEVAATVQVKPGCRVGEAELAAFCQRNMSAFMVPRYIELVDTMPLTGSQKIEKYKLKERAQRELARFWDRVAPA